MTAKCHGPCSVRRRHNHCKSTAYKHNQRRQDAQMSSKSEAIERKIEVKKNNIPK